MSRIYVRLTYAKNAGSIFDFFSYVERRVSKSDRARNTYSLRSEKTRSQIILSKLMALPVPPRNARKLGRFNRALLARARARYFSFSSLSLSPFSPISRARAWVNRSSGHCFAITSKMKSHVLWNARYSLASFIHNGVHTQIRARRSGKGNANVCDRQNPK